MEEAVGKIEDPINQFKVEGWTDESVITALEVLERCCDDPDCARNGEKLDGLQPLLDVLGSHGGPILVRALKILALLFPNSPNIQEEMLQVLREAPKGSEDRSKALRAISAAVRQLATAEEQLLRDNDGVNLLLECMALDEDSKMREKAAFFVRSLAENGRLLTEEISSLAEAVAPLFGNVSAENIQCRETPASCACELARAARGNCATQFVTAAQARLAELRAMRDANAEVEMAVLSECVAWVGFADACIA